MDDFQAINTNGPSQSVTNVPLVDEMENEKSISITNQFFSIYRCIFSTPIANLFHDPTKPKAQEVNEKSDHVPTGIDALSVDGNRQIESLILTTRNIAANTKSLTNDDENP